jgi:L-arabinose isomerase
VTEGDKVEAEIRFGMSVNTWGVNDLVAVVDAVPDKDVDALIEEYSDLYEIEADLRPGGDRHESVRYQARIEAALRSFLVDGGFGGSVTMTSYTLPAAA